ncbi:DUF551 domain-containing protein [Salmonella enterica]|nr:DUF551 domain-containing protein [Salmonella enterica]ECB2072317.1 DUF551 domain-containing protein [Salmonella enterica subsp. enterica serovar Benin]EBE6986288.1 DUF551 domain-containing protein [Salmonella enterica]EBE7297265.1 DUF551 domain-containing protein [Salmonella enterica]EEO5749539.1 DUF551 domain-containing protein [Salmonella enterica]
MTTITKEWLQQTIAEFENTRDDIPFGLNDDDAKILIVLKRALAALTAEPVLYAAEETLAYANMGEIHLTCLSEPMGDAVIPLYTAPPVPVVPEEIEPDSNNTYDYVDGWNACRAAMLQGAEPVSQTYELPELIEGMEVSIDVSTCDADAGNRYFGTVTEVSELDSAKNGYILLVQDAEPNFKPAGNSPAIPGGWISCSERMPDKGQRVLVCVDFDSSTVTPLVKEAEYTSSTFRIGPNTINTTGKPSVTHWMPVPAAPEPETMNG